GWSLSMRSHEPSTVTDAMGRYAFFDLPPGSYRIGEVDQANWTRTFPSAAGVQTIQLAAGQELRNVDFGARSEVLFGDYDRNGWVDGADFLLWQRALGSSATPGGSGADGNNNGLIDAGDLAPWQAGYGTSLPQIDGTAVAASSAALRLVDDALAEFDAAAVHGPWATRSNDSAVGRVRPAYRPLPTIESTALRSVVAHPPALLDGLNPSLPRDETDAALQPNHDVATSISESTSVGSGLD
ncbi:MAG TPA: hypothetical protein PKC18_13095, partial [Lacipirellulaceae bacterium]|nr:hypothetical protein [Lacipirellulaceae bacterium]